MNKEILRADILYALCDLELLFRQAHLNDLAILIKDIKTLLLTQPEAKQEK